MDILQISSQFYVVRYNDESKNNFVILDGPYPEYYQAVSISRLNDK